MKIFLSLCQKSYEEKLASLNLFSFEKIWEKHGNKMSTFGGENIYIYIYIYIYAFIPYPSGIIGTTHGAWCGNTWILEISCNWCVLLKIHPHFSHNSCSLDALSQLYHHVLCCRLITMHYTAASSLLIMPCSHYDMSCCGVITTHHVMISLPCVMPQSHRHTLCHGLITTCHVSISSPHITLWPHRYVSCRGSITTCCAAILSPLIMPQFYHHVTTWHAVFSLSHFMLRSHHHPSCHGLSTMCYATISLPRVMPLFHHHLSCRCFITMTTICHATVSWTHITPPSYHHPTPWSYHHMSHYCFITTSHGFFYHHLSHCHHIIIHHRTASSPCHICQADYNVGLSSWSLLSTSAMMAMPNEKRAVTSEISQPMKTALFWGCIGLYTWAVACTRHGCVFS